MPAHLALTGGRIRRIQPRATQEAPAGPVRVLVALVGLYRHFREGFAALDEQLFQPNEAKETSFAIALFTDPTNICSPKERSEGRCDCVELPNDIATTAAEVYGRRLIKVRLASYNNPKARLADAWYSEGGLRTLSPAYDATLVIRPDAKLVRLTRPFIIRTLCWQPRRPTFEFHTKTLNGRSLRSTIRSTTQHSGSSPAPRQSEQTFMSNGGWIGYLACGALSAAVAFSFDEEESQMERPTVVSELLDEEGVTMDLITCPVSPTAPSRSWSIHRRNSTGSATQLLDRKMSSLVTRL